MAVRPRFFNLVLLFSFTALNLNGIGCEAGEGVAVKKNEEEPMKNNPPPIVSVRKLALSDFRIVRRLRQILKGWNETSASTSKGTTWRPGLEGPWEVRFVMVGTPNSSSAAIATET